MKLIRTLAFLFPIVVSLTCGSKAAEDKKDGAIPVKPKPVVPPVVVVPPAASALAQGFWVANSQSRLVGRFDMEGKKVGELDFQSVSATGGVSAITAWDTTVGFASVDPGTIGGGEVIVSFDPASGAIKVPAWWRDILWFNNVVSRTILPQVIAGSLVVPTNTTVERLVIEPAGGSRAQGVGGGADSLVAPIASGVCAFTAVNSVALIQVGDTKSLLLLSSDPIPKLIVLSNAATLPTCDSAYDYSVVGSPTSATHVPVAAVQMPNNLVFVLFQHPTASRLVSYVTDGRTLANPVVVYQDAGALGALPTGLAKLTDTSVLIGNPVAGRVFEVTTAGTLGLISIASSFTSSVSAIAVIP